MGAISFAVLTAIFAFEEPLFANNTQTRDQRQAALEKQNPDVTGIVQTLWKLSYLPKSNDFLKFNPQAQKGLKDSEILASLIEFEAAGFSELASTGINLASPLLGAVSSFVDVNLVQPPVSDSFYTYNVGKQKSPSDADILMSLVRFEAQGALELSKTAFRPVSTLLANTFKFASEGRLNSLALLNPPKTKESSRIPLAYQTTPLEPQVLAETDISSLAQRVSQLEGQVLALGSLEEFGSSGVNLLRNSSFESDGLKTSPKNWSYNNTSALKNTFVNNGQVHSGNLALRIEASGLEAGYGIYQPTVKTQKGAPYVLSTYLFASGTDSFTIRLGFWDRAGNKRVGSRDFGVSAGGWKRFVQKISTNTGDWYPFIEVLNLSRGNVYLDDLQLEEGTVVSVYKPGSGATDIPGASALGDGSIIADAQGNLYPTKDGVGDLGISGGRWGQLKLLRASIDKDGNASFAGALSAGSVNSNLTPNATNTYDLGSSTNYWNRGYITTLTVSSCTGCGGGGISGITVQEGDSDVDTTATTLDFLGADFDVTSSPSGEANVALSSAVAHLDAAETISANWVNTANPWADNEVANDLTISGGTLNSTTIGATTASTGAFTTLSSTGATTLGNNSATVAIDSSDWDISTTGNLSGIGTLSLDGDITWSATTPNIAINDTESFTITDGTNTLLTLADAGTTGNLTISGDLTISGGNVTSATTFDSTLTATGTLTANGALTANGSFTLGDNGDTGSINTSDWDISTTGDLSGIGTLSLDGDITWSATTPTVTINNAETFAISDGTNTIFSLADGGTSGNLSGIGTITADGDLTISQATPSVLLTDTDASADDYSLNANGSSFTIRNETDSRDDLTISGTGGFTINGGSVGEGTSSLTVTSGNLTVTDGDFTLSSGEISASSDDLSGNIFSFSGASNSLGSGTTLLADSTATSATAAAYTGTIGKFSFGRTGGSNSTLDFTGDVLLGTYTYSGSGTAGTRTLSGQVAQFDRSITNSNAGGTTSVTGTLFTVSNTLTQTAGTVTDTASLASFTQNCGTSVTCDADTVLISNASTGDLLVLNSTGAVTTDNGLVIRPTNASGTITDGIQIGTGTDTITNGINFGSTGITNDIVLQNSETIDNNTDGTVTVTATNFNVSGIYQSAGSSGVARTCSATQSLNDIDTVGGIVTAGTCTTNAADIAEQYGSTETLEPGEVVVIDLDNALGTKKSTGPYQPNLLGIVSTSPYRVLNDDEPGYPIALIGRVPTKVSTENGPIEIGDHLTSSSEPGVAMKATSTGPVVGKALEPYNGSGIGSIEVFVNVSYYVGSVTDDGGLALTGEEVLGTTTDGQNQAGPSASPTPQSQTSGGSVNDDETLVQKIVEALKSLGITVKDAVVSIKEALIDKLTVKELAVDNKDEDAAVGHGSIPQGATETIIKNNKVKKNSKIFVTSTVALNQSLAVVEKIENEGFKVALSHPEGKEVIFDFFIIQTTNDSQPQSQSEPNSLQNSQDQNLNPQPSNPQPSPTSEPQATQSAQPQEASSSAQ